MTLRRGNGPSVTASASELLDHLDAYCDALPRTASTVQRVGPFELFVGRPDGWPFYTRPARGTREKIGPSDVITAITTMRELGVPEQIEWIEAAAPELAPACRNAGLVVTELPLLVLPPDRELEVKPPHGDIEVHRVGEEDDLATFAGVATVAFSNPGTDPGAAGVRELAEATRLRPPALVEFERERIAQGHTVMMGVLAGGIPVASGSHQPLGDTTEIVGIGTLPAFRRRGFGALVTQALVTHARSIGIRNIFLTAGDEEIARVYERVGFERIASAYVAMPG